MEINKFDEMVNKIKQCAFNHIIFEGGYDENEDVFKPRETTQVVGLDTVIEILNEHGCLYPNHIKKKVRINK